MLCPPCPYLDWHVNTLERCPMEVNLLVMQSDGVWGGAIGLSIVKGLLEIWCSRSVHWLVSHLTTTTAAAATATTTTNNTNSNNSNNNNSNNNHHHHNHNNNNTNSSSSGGGDNDNDDNLDVLSMFASNAPCHVDK